MGIEIEISEEENISKFARIRQRLDHIIRYIDEDNHEKEERRNKKMQQIREIESEMVNRVQAEMEANKEMEKRLTFLVEQRTSDLRAQLAAESKQRFQAVENISSRYSFNKKSTADGIASLNEQYQQN